MSKSDENKSSRILLTTHPDQVRRSLSRAITDSESGIYSSPSRPGVTNLLNILSAFENKTIQEIEGEVKNLSMRDFKERVAESIIAGLAPIQERYKQVASNRQWLTMMRLEGNSRAREIAARRMMEIKKIVGLS
jgi:tryptophanyl-tRNA synthetase